MSDWIVSCEQCSSGRGAQWLAVVSLEHDAVHSQSIDVGGLHITRMEANVTPTLDKTRMLKMVCPDEIKFEVIM